MAGAKAMVLYPNGLTSNPKFAPHTQRAAEMVGDQGEVAEGDLVGHMQAMASPAAAGADLYDRSATAPSQTDKPPQGEEATPERPNPTQWRHWAQPKLLVAVQPCVSCWAHTTNLVYPQGTDDRTHYP